MATTTRKKEFTAADVWAMFAETDRKIAETDRILSEKFAETDRKIAETDRILNEKFEKLGIKVSDVNSKVDGIGKSNGKFAEEYFLSSLERRKEFAGVHFDYVSDGFKRFMKMQDGSKIKDQFDVVMVNDDAIAIIEVKYRADKDYLEEMATRKVKNFRILFPDYKDSKIYLGLGSLSFDEYVVKEAKKYGIGLLRQVGDVIEYETDWVRAY